MDQNTIIDNGEVIEMTEDVVTSSNNGAKIAGYVGLGVLGGMMAYRYIVQPIIAKIKAKKSMTAANVIDFPDEKKRSEEAN